MDNQTLFKELQKTLIDGLAQTENRVLQEVAAVKTDVAAVKTEVAYVKTDLATVKKQMATKADMDKRFEEVKESLTAIQGNFEVEVANEMWIDKQQVQQEIDFLKRRLQTLEAKFSGT